MYLMVSLIKERISELEDRSIETSKTEIQKEKKMNEKDWTEYSRTVGQLQKVYIHVISIPKGEERKEQKKYLKF